MPGFARPQTEAEMASLALGHLGLAPIADLNDNNIRARAAKQFFATVRDAMQREKWWKFAAANFLPLADPEPGLGVLKTRYRLPEACLRVRYLYDDNGGIFYDDDGRWEIEAAQVAEDDEPTEGMMLVTDIASPRVAMTRRVENVREWDSVFVTAFGYELASMMGRRLGRSRTLGESLHASAERALDTAATIDSKQKSRKSLTRTPSIVLARTGWRSPGGWWRNRW